MNPAWHSRQEQEPKPATPDEAIPDAAMKSGDRKIKSQEEENTDSEKSPRCSTTRRKDPDTSKQDAK
jgi:hypothetical protein